ncbi:DnaJ domain-containing protein [Myroides sp. NP-2]|uniref:DnaJ domain-containing protein n=1 Tax=Myroides sp. NP-2 TaxID=2759945 RepID=UPI002106B634|nr:DnaJ domain-containing protein [Myroides sp. NP-2]
MNSLLNLQLCMPSYYAILELEPTATSGEIKQAFRRLSKLYHPDMNQGNTTYQHKLFEVVKAYETLGNEVTRKAYDLTLFRTTAEPSRATNAGYASSTTSYANLYQPEIVEFSCNQTYCFVGDILEISWKCKNADIIRIYPLGYMDELKGKVVYRVREMRTKYLFFELTVTNNYSSIPVKKVIKLDNGTQLRFTEAHRDDFANYTAPYSWGWGFLAPVGRSSRKDYALRMALLGSLFVVVYLGQPFFEYEDTFSFLSTVLIYLAIICSARRLHDVSWHGIFALTLLIPFLNVPVLLVLFLLKGVELPNKYGRKPKF